MYTYETCHESVPMANRATITFHTTPEVRARLDQLAAITKRSRSFLTNAAVEKYLAEEEDFLRDVEAGLADIDAGRVMSSAELKQSLAEHVSKTHGGPKSE